MSDFLFSVLSWLFPPFLGYLIHPVFMGMVIPSRLKCWWQIMLLAAFVSLFNLPKAIWGIYSVSADVFRIISLPVMHLAIPLLLFKGPVWKRLLTNLLMFSGQIVGEGMAVWTVTSPTNVRVENVVTNSFQDAVIYAVVGMFCNALFDGLVVIIARSLQARKFSWVYIPVICIVLSLWGMFYAYIADANRLFCCVCTVLAGGSILSLLQYVVALENKTALEEELRNTRHRMALEQAHYKAVEARQEELARIRHDFNNQLAAVSLLIQSGEENDAQSMLRQLGENIAATREEPYCSVPVINAVLTEKAAMCEREGIRLEVQLDLPDTLTMDPLHLCSIFANLLDNAAKAAKFTAEPTITLSSAVAGDYLFIKTVNPSLPPKKPGQGHGYGSKILKQLSAKYDGSYQTSYEDGVFTAVVTLLLEQSTN